MSKWASSDQSEQIALGEFGSTGEKSVARARINSVDGKGQGASRPTCYRWVWSRDPWAWRRRAEEGSRTFILGIARMRRPNRVIGRVAATALGVFQMRHGSGVEGDLGPFLCILRLGRGR